MIVPRMPPEVPPPPGVVVTVGVGDTGGVDVGEELGVGAALVDGGVVCLDFEGVAEDGCPPGLEDFPDFLAPGVWNPVPLATAAPCLPWAFLCPDRDVEGFGVFTAGAASADGTDGASAELTGGDV
jgi:hypothetical protein